MAEAKYGIVAGYDGHPAPSSAAARRGRGGPRCMTCPIERDGA